MSTPQEKQYVKHLEDEVCRLKEQLAAKPPTAPLDALLEGPSVLDLLVQDLDRTPDSGIFVWKCALPIGAISVFINREELIALCSKIVTDQTVLLTKAGILPAPRQ